MGLEAGHIASEEWQFNNLDITGVEGYAKRSPGYHLMKANNLKDTKVDKM